VSGTVAWRLDGESAATGGHYEYRVLTIPHSTSRGDACRLLTDEAEYGRWELARTCVYAGGRSKILRSTLDAAAN
jgi:hypothetical protein